VRTPKTKIHEQLSRCRQDHAHCLPCHQGLELKNVDEARLDELRDGQGRGDEKNGLVRKEYDSIVHRVHSTRETEVQRVFDEITREPAAGPEDA
jgi:hypothetical protein